MENHQKQPYNIEDSVDNDRVQEPIAAYGYSNERLMVQGMETFMKLRHSNQLAYIVAMMNIALRNSQPWTSNTNRERLTSKLEELVSDKQLQETYEPFSICTIDNTKKFLSLAPVDELLSQTSLSPRINGTILINWRTDNMFGSINIGERNFSYTLLCKADMKSISLQCDINDIDAICEFYKQLQERR